MSHNYQFLHSVVRGVYKDLRVEKSDAVPAELMAEVRKYASIFDAQQIGLSANYCYFMVPDAKGTPNLFFAKVARKEKSTSLCHYTQCAGWRFNNVYSLPSGALRPSDDFDSIFDFSFFTEDEIDAYAAENPSASFGRGSDAAPVCEPFVIAPEAIRAILHGVVGRWITGSEPVHIEVPDGVDYNAYVMQAVKQIYSYFPVGFKTNVGFASYIAPGNEANYMRIGIVFVPRTGATRNTIRLDGSSAMAYKTLVGTTFGPKLDAFMEHLAYLNDGQERKEFLETVLIDAEYSAAEDKIAGIKPMRYSILGSSMNILKMRGSVEEMFPFWLDFVENRKKYPQGISLRITERIHAELTAEAFAGVLRNGKAIARPTDAASFNAALNKLYQLCDQRADLYQVLWRYTAAALKSGFLTDEASFDWLADNESILATYAEAESCAQLKSEYAARCTEKIWNAAEAKIRSESLKDRADYRKKVKAVAEKAVSMAGKYEDVAQWSHKLLSIAEDRIAADVDKALAQLKEKVLVTADQYKLAMAECRKLIAALPEAGVYTISDSIREKAEQYLTALEQQHSKLMNSVATLVESFGNNYFVAIDKYEARKHSLTEEQKREVEKVLTKLRPVSMAKYCKSYELQTGKRMGASALIHENAAAGEIIRKDMLRFLSNPIEMSLERRSAGDIAAELEYYISLSRFFETGKSAVVRVKLPGFSDYADFSGNGGMEWKAAALRDVVNLVLEKDKASADKEEDVYAIVTALHDSGAIKPDHEYAILEMLLRCGYYTAAEKLYHKFDALEGTAIKEKFRKQYESQNRARRAKKDKSNTIFMTVFAGLSAVLLIAVIVLAIILGSTAKKLDEAMSAQPVVETTIATETVETVPVTTAAETVSTSEPTVPEETEMTEGTGEVTEETEEVTMPTNVAPDMEGAEEKQPGKNVGILEKRAAIEGTYTIQQN